MSRADQLTELGFSAAWSAVPKLPEPVAHAMFERAADVTWRKRGAGVRQLERNLSRVYGGSLDETALRALSRDAMRRYLRYYREIFQLPTWSDERAVSTFRGDDDHYITESIANGSGAVIALPHMGNYDHAGRWATLVHRPVVTVVERLKPDKLFEQFVDLRASEGIGIYPLTGEGDPFRWLVEQVRSGRLACLLADRDIGAKGVPVRFFGEVATMPAGPAALAVMTGVPLIPGVMWAEESVNVARMFEPLEVPKNVDRTVAIAMLMQKLAEVFEVGIRAHAADWHMLQPLWWNDLDPARRRPLESLDTPYASDQS